MLLFLVSLVTVFASVASTFAHCEIPCGIYDDKARINMLLENAATIEKSMLQITKLENNHDHHFNQLVRWVMNKELHAGKIQEIVSQYFLTQRIKFNAKKYEVKLKLLHQMLVYAMKCKQTTDVANVEHLRKLIREFESLYFSK